MSPVLRCRHFYGVAKHRQNEHHNSTVSSSNGYYIGVHLRQALHSTDHRSGRLQRRPQGKSSRHILTTVQFVQKALLTARLYHFTCAIACCRFANAIIIQRHECPRAGTEPSHQSPCFINKPTTSLLQQLSFASCPAPRQRTALMLGTTA